MRPDEIIGVAWAVAWPPVWAANWPRIVRLLRGRPPGGFWGWWIVASVTTVLTQALAGDLPATAAATVSTVFAAIMWWLSRRRRKRASRAYGAKSRALVAAVVAKMRQSLKPRPVFRPMPGRAG